MQLSFVTSHFGSSETVGFMPVVASALSRRGHEVRGVQYERGETIDSIPVERLETREVDTPYWAGQWLFYRDWRPTIRDHLAANAADVDVVVADRRCTVPTIQAARDLDLPVVGVIPGLGFSRFAPRDLQRDKAPRFGRLPLSARLQYPFVRSLHRQHGRALDAADELLVVSEFLRDRLRRTYGVDSTVVRTPVVPEAVRAERHEPEVIAMINPRSQLKGADVFLDVAEAMPERTFVVAGTFPSDALERRAEAAPNVRHLGWVEDIREVYERTTLVMVPSLVEEGGPRVIAEAFVNAIPVVGTERGGIPEFVGDAGRIVDPPQDTEAWMRAIEAVLDERAEYAERAASRAELFHIDEAVNVVERVLEEVVV